MISTPTRPGFAPSDGATSVVGFPLPLPEDPAAPLSSSSAGSSAARRSLFSRTAASSLRRRRNALPLPLPAATPPLSAVTETSVTSLIDALKISAMVSRKFSFTSSPNADFATPVRRAVNRTAPPVVRAATPSPGDAASVLVPGPSTANTVCFASEICSATASARRSAVSDLTAASDSAAVALSTVSWLALESACTFLRAFCATVLATCATSASSSNFLAIAAAASPRMPDAADRPFATSKATFARFIAVSRALRVSVGNVPSRVALSKSCVRLNTRSSACSTPPTAAFVCASRRPFTSVSCISRFFSSFFASTTAFSRASAVSACLRGPVADDPDPEPDAATAFGAFAATSGSSGPARSLSSDGALLPLSLPLPPPLPLLLLLLLPGIAPFFRVGLCRLGFCNLTGPVELLFAPYAA